ncbi:MAG TPA: hypothetical protein VMZ00_12540 [Sporichthya sp.]|nr:hypothetical protein [Sporichthya sp.]
MRRLSRTIRNRKRRQRRLTRISLLAAPALAIPGAVMLFAPVGQAALLDPVHCAYDDPGMSPAVTCIYKADDEFVVPNGVSFITVSARGENGQAGTAGPGGVGATAEVTLDTPPGTEYALNVADGQADLGLGGSAQEGGGAGGTASVVLAGGVALLAGGGGGGGTATSEEGGGDAGAQAAPNQLYAPGEAGDGGPSGGTDNMNPHNGGGGTDGGGGGGGGFVDSGGDGGGGKGGASNDEGGGGGASFGPANTNFTANEADDKPQIVVTYTACQAAQGIYLGDDNYVLESDNGPGGAWLEFFVYVEQSSDCSDTIVTVQTDDGLLAPPSADTPSDYEDLPTGPDPYTVTIPAGKNSYVGVGYVPINGDDNPELDENFVLRITEAVAPDATDPEYPPYIYPGYDTAVATIINDDGPIEEEPGPISTPIADGGFCDGLPVTHAGGSGNDTIEGTPGDDVIRGGSGDNVINGHGGHDVICAEGGNDVINAGGGTGSIFGGPGNDQINLEGGTYSVDPGSGNDTTNP